MQQVKEDTKMKTHKVLYEPEDDVLNIWLSKKPIDYAEDDNGVIIHYTKTKEPVYIEILDATRFFKESGKTSWSKDKSTATIS